MSRARTFLVERGGALALATLALYLWVAPAHITNGDNADFVATSALGGVAHPSGYPLYSLWLRAWSWLPVNPAHAAAIATAILAPLLVLVLHAACRAWGARPLAATAAVALFVTSPIVLRVQSEAEVFALNSLISALVLWLAAERGPVTATRRVVLLCLVAGLGLAHNLTCVLVAPVGILGVVRGVRESPARGRALGLGAVALGAGLVPYLSLLASPATPVSWGEVTSLSDLARHALRLDYGTWKLAAHGDELYPAANLTTLGATAVRAYLWLPCALGAIALVVAALGKLRGETRVAWATLIAAWLLTGPVLVARFNVEPADLGAYLTERFHIQSLVVFAVFVAAGIELVAARWTRATPRLAGGILAAAAFVAGAALSLPELARRHSPAVEQGLRNILATVPPSAIVIGAPDELHFGMGYLQHALGIREDVTVIATPQLGLPYYRERLRARTGFVVEKPDAGETVTVLIAEQALASGRPVFVDAFQANIARAFPVVPHGILFRVLPRGSRTPPLDEIFATTKEVFSQYRFGYPLPGPRDHHATRLHATYARVWRSLGDALAKAGRTDDAELARGLAADLAPRAE